ncbi:GNAT family N-acetyltransferase [Pelagibius sp. CAU 1746]|uniref:GNAT family N-acetyltransferase n=1 Tax=Pelagibius sp. CAU 1746 TaxID=3140370 RepID=UPI00325AA495
MSQAAVNCRLATAADAAALAELFYLSDVHYWGDRAAPREAMAAHVRNEVLSEKANIEVLLAEAGGKAVGFASFAVLHPAPDLGGQLFLKDLFVPQTARGLGIGGTLLRRLAGIAVERGCVRLDWTAEADNPRALALYDRLGARRLAEKVYFRFDGEALKEFAAGD